MICNKNVKIAMIKHDLKQYQLAQLMNTHESAVSRMLKDELPAEEQDRIVRLIEEETKKNEKE